MDRAKFLKKKGFISTFGDKVPVYYSRGDGACMLRSICHQLYGDEERHKVFRVELGMAMLENVAEYAHIIWDRIAADFQDEYYKRVPKECREIYSKIIKNLEIEKRVKEKYPFSENFTKIQMDQFQKFIMEIFSNDKFHGSVETIYVTTVSSKVNVIVVQPDGSVSFIVDFNTSYDKTICLAYDAASYHYNSVLVNQTLAHEWAKVLAK